MNLPSGKVIPDAEVGNSIRSILEHTMYSDDMNYSTEFILESDMEKYNLDSQDWYYLVGKITPILDNIFEKVYNSFQEIFMANLPSEYLVDTEE